MLWEWEAAGSAVTQAITKGISEHYRQEGRLAEELSLDGELFFLKRIGRCKGWRLCTGY
jgi:hypothetical protein